MTLKSLVFIFLVQWQYQAILGQCPPGAYSGLEPTECYTLPLPKMSWWDAEQACWNVSGDFISIHDATFNNFIHSMTGNLATNFWAGASNVMNGTWQWSDETSFNYTNWQKGYEVVIKQRCLAIEPSSGKWLKEKCNEEKPFMCKVPAIPQEQPTPAPCPACPSQSTLLSTLLTCPPAPRVTCPPIQQVTPEPCPVCPSSSTMASVPTCPPAEPVPSCPAPPTVTECPQPTACPLCAQCQQCNCPNAPPPVTCCPSGWTYLSETQMCHAFTDSDLVWYDAGTACTNAGGRLASVHSDEQNQALLNLASQNGYTWVYIGLFDDGNGLTWNDGSDVSYAQQYSVWYGTDPSQTAPTFCVTAEAYGLTWATIDCWSGSSWAGLCELNPSQCSN
jgi:hypothetical protein